MAELGQVLFEQSSEAFGPTVYLGKNGNARVCVDSQQDLSGARKSGCCPPPPLFSRVVAPFLLFSFFFFSLAFSSISRSRLDFVIHHVTWLVLPLPHSLTSLLFSSSSFLRDSIRVLRRPHNGSATSMHVWV